MFSQIHHREGKQNDKFNSNTKLTIKTVVHCDSLSHTSENVFHVCEQLKPFVVSIFTEQFWEYIFSNVCKQILLLFG